MIDFAAVRRNMVDTQLRTYDVSSKRVLDAVEEVARERYLPDGMAALAYADQAVVWRFGEGAQRAMLPPMVIARMIQSAEIERGNRVLTVAGASGYAAAVMEAMGASVTLLESAGMASSARRALAADGAQVEVVEGELTAGHGPAAPYDAILIEGAIAVEPTALLGQLGDGGRLVAIMGEGRSGRVVVFMRSGESLGRRAVFDAAASQLLEFKAPAGFDF